MFRKRPCPSQQQELPVSASGGLLGLGTTTNNTQEAALLLLGAWGKKTTAALVVFERPKASFKSHCSEAKPGTLRCLC